MIRLHFKRYHHPAIGWCWGVYMSPGAAEPRTVCTQVKMFGDIARGIASLTKI